MTSDNVRAGERGRLRVFIGAAPGVGKTYTMLKEAHRLKEAGVDVVIGYVDTHGRLETERLLEGLELVPLAEIRVGQAIFHEPDLEAILRRRPQVCVIDELAHTNPPGMRHEKRYQDIEYLLAHGISVMTAVNVQHLASIREEAYQALGLRVVETVPDEFIRQADEVTVIDVTPETLRQRLRDGEIYPKDRVDRALQHFFRLENLSWLRVMALRAVADDVDERLHEAYERKDGPGFVGVKEVVLVSVGHPERAEALLSRGRRMAMRMQGDLFAVYVAETAEDRMTERSREEVERLRQLAERFGAEWILEPKNDRPLGEVIANVARRIEASQIVVGQSRPGFVRWPLARWRSPAKDLIKRLPFVDVRVVGWRSLAPSALSQRNWASVRLVREQKLPGKLTVYVGAAPGVGKTYKMLQDAHDWRQRGVDVVIGHIETHGRKETEMQIGDLERIPKKKIAYSGQIYEEPDIQAILARRPDVVLIDELAHTNAPGSRFQKRYQDILYLLEHGVNVVTAVNIQHLESLKDRVEQLTGAPVKERVPDWFMKLASEVKLIDVAPETLIERMMQGKIYPPEKAERALNHYFQPANLAALRELALREVADDVEHRVDSPLRPEEAERILVCTNYRAHSERLIRRGWRIADRLKAKLYVLVVQTEPALTLEQTKELEQIKELAQSFGAEFLIREGKSIGPVIVDTARALDVSQIIMGRPLEQGVARWFAPRPIMYVLAHAEFADLHIVAHMGRCFASV